MNPAHDTSYSFANGVEERGRRFGEPLGKPQVSNLYGGYIHPGSAGADSLTLIVSQWPGNNAPQPYRVLQFDGINP